MFNQIFIVFLQSSIGLHKHFDGGPVLPDLSQQLVFFLLQLSVYPFTNNQIIHFIFLFNSMFQFLYFLLQSINIPYNAFPFLSPGSQNVLAFQLFILLKIEILLHMENVPLFIKYFLFEDVGSEFPTVFQPLIPVGFLFVQCSLFVFLSDFFGIYSFSLFASHNHSFFILSIELEHLLLHSPQCLL